MVSTDFPSGAVEPELPPLAPTGVPGLDAILHGGFPRDEMHMVQGVAGTGKTTLSLQFLREAVRAGEPCVYVTFSQSKQHLERIARSHGWSTEGITIHEISPGTVADRVSSRQTVLATVELELEALFSDLERLVAEVRPRRAVVDSITILEILAGSTPRYHREVVTLRQLFVEQGCTLLTMADHPAERVEGSPPEVIFHPLCGCVVHLEQESQPYGDVRRRLRVVKSRGLPGQGGYHDFTIGPAGMEVYPRLGAYTMPDRSELRPMPSGIPALDAMLGGGVETGTSCLLVGPSGSGKSSLATAFVLGAIREGGNAAIFLFDERPEIYMARADGLGLPLRQEIEAGRVKLRQVDPGGTAPGRFAQEIRRGLELENIRVVVIDSVIGYFAAMGAADVLVTQLHEILTYVTRSGGLLIMCGAQEGFMSIGTSNGVDVSYLSDTIVVLGYYEADAVIHRCISVVKKKHGGHDTSIRELSASNTGIHVGEHPLSGLHPLLLSDTRPVAGRAGADQ